MYQNAFIKNGTSVCHAAADGKLTVGWLQQGSTYYYFDENGEQYFDRFFEYDNNTYRVNADGKMVTGWQKINGTYYYFRGWGGMYVVPFSSLAVKCIMPMRMERW